jgi:hypothetical protein
MDRLGNQMHPMTQTLFPNNSAVSKMTVLPLTQLELFSRGLKSMKMNFNIFSGQHNHQTRTSLNHFGQLWKQVINRFAPPSSLKQHENVPQE